MRKEQHVNKTLAPLRLECAVGVKLHMLVGCGVLVEAYTPESAHLVWQHGVAHIDNALWMVFVGGEKVIAEPAKSPDLAWLPALRESE